MKASPEGAGEAKTKLGKGATVVTDAINPAADAPRIPPWALKQEPSPQPRLPMRRAGAAAAQPQDEGDSSPGRIDAIDRNEVMAVIRDVFSVAPDGLSRDDAKREIARALGYKRAGSRIEEVLDNDIRTAVRRGILENTSAGLRLLARSIRGYSREHLINMCLSDLPSGWCERDDVIVGTARYLGFRRTGSEIRKAFKSAINGAIRRGLLEYEGSRVRKAKA